MSKIQFNPAQGAITKVVQEAKPATFTVEIPMSLAYLFAAIHGMCGAAEPVDEAQTNPQLAGAAAALKELGHGLDKAIYDAGLKGREFMFKDNDQLKRLLGQPSELF
jgi:hypothetical protein